MTQSPAPLLSNRPADSSALRLRRRAVVLWESPGGLPRSVLVVKKVGNPQASLKLLEMAEWLEARGVEVRGFRR